MNRAKVFYLEQLKLIKENADFVTDDISVESDHIFASGLTNGDIEKPEWLCIYEGSECLKLWDKINPSLVVIVDYE